MCVPKLKSKTVKGREYKYYEAKCTTGYDSLTGKQIQRTITGKTKKAVVEKYKKMQSEVDLGTYTTPTKMTVSEWLDIWLNDYCKKVKPRTLDSYMTNCKIHIKPVLGKKMLSALTALEIQRFLNNLTNTKTGQPLSAKTVNNVHGTLHKALARAKKLGYISKNPADAEYIERPKITAPEINPFEDDDVTKLIEELSGNPYRNVILTMLFCGLREGEALGLSYDTIDFDNHTIRIVQQLQKNRLTKQYEIVTPKNGKSRVLCVPDYVISMLREQQQEQETMRKQAGKGWNNQWNLVFTREDGRHLCPQTVYCNFKRRVKAIGCADRRPHDLRHTFAVASLQAGDNIKTVQGNLGHHNAAFTLQTYAHVTDGMRRESAAHMNSYIDKVMSQMPSETA